MQVGITYKFISDPGHGWLEVPHQDLIDLGVDNKISKYSYLDRSSNMAYLEEDLDAGVFMDRYKEVVGSDLVYKRVHQENTFIRDLTHYQ